MPLEKQRAATIVSRYAKRYLGTNTTKILVSKLFKDFIQHLRNVELVNNVKLCMKRLQFICHATDKSYLKLLANAPHQQIHSKVILSMFMIKYYSEEVLPDFTSKESKRLSAAVDPFFESFWRVVLHFKDNAPMGKDELVMFFHCMMEYVDAYSEWKKMDEICLSRRIMLELKILYEEYNMQPYAVMVKGQCNVLRARIMTLRSNLMDVCGKRAFEEFDRKYPCPFATQACVPNVQQVLYSNDALTHEMLLDPKFRIRDVYVVPYSDLDGKAAIRRQEGRDMYYKIISDEFARPDPRYHFALRVLSNVRDKVMSIQKQDAPDFISAAMDLAQLRTTIKENKFTWLVAINLFYKICGMFRQMQHPSRAAQLELEWSDLFAVMHQAQTDAQKGVAFAQALRFCECVSDRLLLDKANFQMSRIAPELQRRGVEIERATMRRRLDAGEINMDSVVSFLRCSLEGLSDHALHMVQTNDKAFRDFMERSMTALANPMLEARELPVTMELDAFRIRYVRVAVANMALGCVLLLHLRNHMGLRNADQLERQVVDLFKTHAVVSYETLVASIPALRPMDRALFSQDNPNFKELVGHILRIIVLYCGSMSRHKKSAPIRAHYVLGLNHFLPKLQKACYAMHEATWIALTVHGDMYKYLANAIISKDREAKHAAAAILLELGKR